jgi:SAM-dependent methyltransferase
MKKINLGAGNDIRKDFINHDIDQIGNIDVVHDLNIYPWPWENNSIDEILALDIYEHLDNFIKSMEETHRILKDNGNVFLKVPYWNSSSAYIDPTHKRGFHELTFDFFDPSREFCKLRPYYSTARFKIISIAYIINLFQPYISVPFIKKIKVQNKILKKIVGLLANIFGNIILDLEVELKKI